MICLIVSKDILSCGKAVNMGSLHSMSEIDFDRFRNISFEGFKQLAQDDSLTQYERIGFPNSYREGYEDNIFKDITSKLQNLLKEDQFVIDIGSGCSDLPVMLINLCRKQGHKLLLVDSPEMLAHLPDEPFIVKMPAYYPDECPELFDDYEGKIDVILTYSVLHYVFAEGRLFDFLDRSLSLLSERGEMLIGDVPNIAKRKRFFNSKAGIEFHQQFTGTDEVPATTFNRLESGQIDDSVILSIILRCRYAGFDAYWLPQANALPMANRREDILVRKP